MLAVARAAGGCFARSGGRTRRALNLVRAKSSLGQKANVLKLKLLPKFLTGCNCQANMIMIMTRIMYVRAAI